MILVNRHLGGDDPLLLAPALVVEAPAELREVDTVRTQATPDRRRGRGLPGLELQLHLRDHPSSLSRHLLPPLDVDA